MMLARSGNTNIAAAMAAVNETPGIALDVSGLTILLTV